VVDRRVRAWAGLVALFGAPIVLFVLLRVTPRLDFVYRDLTFHLIVVTSIAACALVVALFATRAALRAAHPGPVWLAFGCVSLGLLMFAHGLLTPGVNGRPMNLWVARMPYLAITVFAVSLVLAGRARNTLTSRLAVHHSSALLTAPLVVLGALVIWLDRNPTSLAGDHRLAYENQLFWVLAAADAVMLLGAAVVHWRRWRLGHDPVQYSLVLAGAMSTAAMGSLRLGETWRVSWWDYHGFLLAGFGGAVYAVWIRYGRTRAVEDVLAATFDTDPMTHIVHGYPAELRALVRSVEVKDAYTHGHSERTALIAVQLGLRLGVHEDMLRSLARGAYLHDVGKIAIPDEILNKPGRLTREERAVIETHPRLGHDLVAPVPVLHESLHAILHHHERWDSNGYPDGLGGDAIPLIARIVAVADVWDALTSDRSYRPGLDPADALAHIVASRGSHFDPFVVEAFLGLAADWGYHVAAGGGSAEEAWRAAESCHEAQLSRA
jgi:HD-GYP domain-containing protein (c-di-GMP phosphodiesterase class II)